jgi:hypothetical protein
MERRSRRGDSERRFRQTHLKSKHEQKEGQDVPNQ